MTKEHCLECAGHAYAKGDSCNTCDGKGNFKSVAKAEPKKKKSKK